LLSRGDRRGELIRVQCELDHLARAGDRSARRRALAAEEARLLRWYGHAVVPHAYTRRFGRGFVEEVSVSDVTELVAGDVLRDFPTIDTIEITSAVGPADVGDLGDAPGLERLRALSLMALSGSVTALSGSALSGRLRRLVVRGRSADVAAELGTAIAAGCFGQLEELHLMGECFDAAAAEALAAARSPTLTRLTLGYTSRFGDGARARSPRGRPGR
jgi:hypothetical protein